MQYQSATVDAQIAAHDQRIRLLKCTRGLLERTRAEVARHHQPAALIEASHWLARLTEGRYIQITTAADEARLDVHDAAGVIWNPERLSRGTREQVFLALRLALVRDLHEQGITLPVVMDDALVNFDDQRAQAASRTLVEFMNDRNGDHQMLVLTCHAHVATLFRAAKATVRTLGPKQISADDQRTMMLYHRNRGDLKNTALAMFNRQIESIWFCPSIETLKATCRSNDCGLPRHRGVGNTLSDQRQVPCSHTPKKNTKVGIAAK